MDLDKEGAFKRRMKLAEAILKWQDRVKTEKGGKYTKSIADFDWPSITALLGNSEGKDSSSSAKDEPRINCEEFLYENAGLWKEICSLLEPEKDDSQSPKNKRRKKIDRVRKELDDSDMNPYRIYTKLCGTYCSSGGGASPEDGISTHRSRFKSSATCEFPEHFHYDTSIMLLFNPILSTNESNETRKKRSLASQTAASNALSAALVTE